MAFSIKTKFNIYAVGLGIAFVILLGRFAYLQLYLGQEYLQASEKNRVRALEVDAPRGLILDRYETILVDNRPAYAVYAIPAEVRKNPSTYDLLASALHSTGESVRRQITEKRRGNFTPVKVARQIDFAGLSLLQERQLELTGVDFRAESRRDYVHEVKAPHLFGYLSEINDDELTQFGKGYSPGDLIGKKGLERRYEELLRGAKGRRYVEVDALGRVVRDLSENENPLFISSPPQPGKDLILSLDAALQEMLEKELAESNGGSVVLNCKNGEVLALVSKPDYDLDAFAKPLSHQNWNRLANDPDKPLYDRMIQSLFPPGSTFKIILALAGLQSGRIDPDEEVFCPGYYRFGVRNFGCWLKAGHGSVNLLSAMERSCNVYFYRMGLKVGLDHWSDMAKRFGFGKQTGIDLDEESAGTVPDRDYLDRKYGKGKWSKGLVLNLALGQGDLLATPLQMASFAMALANDGRSFRPHLKRGMIDRVAKEKTYDAPDSVLVNGIDPEHYKLVKKGMFLVVHGSQGTARGSRVRGVLMAGKTGTAENPHGDDHAWFIGFAPFEDPQIAFCVFIENGGAGSAKAAPIAKKIVSSLLEQNKIVSYPERTQFLD